MGSVVLDPYLVFLILMTTVLGVIIGVLPGLGATTGAALLLPFTPLTVYLDMLIAIAVVMFVMCLLWGERRIHIAGAVALAI